MMAYQFTILVPIFNEEDAIERLVSKLSEYLEIASRKTNVILIDDGSTDNSRTLIKNYCKGKENFEYILFKNNSGKGGALKAGFEATTAPVLGYIDADLQTYPEDFELLLPHIEEFQLVTGRRITRQDSIVKRFSSRFGNTVRQIFTKDGMNDTGCPLKIIQTSYAKNIPLFAGLQRFLPAMILLQDGKIKEIPIKHYPRIEGESKYGFSNRFMGPLMDCFAYVWMKKTYIKYEIAEKG